MHYHFLFLFIIFYWNFLPVFLGSIRNKKKFMFLFNKWFENFLRPLKMSTKRSDFFIPFNLLLFWGNWRWLSIFLQCDFFEWGRCPFLSFLFNSISKGHFRNYQEFGNCHTDTIQKCEHVQFILFFHCLFEVIKKFL